MNARKLMTSGSVLIPLYGNHDYRIKSSKLQLNDGNRIIFVNYDEIRYFKSAVNQTHIVLTDGTLKKVNLTLNMVSEKIDADSFFRVHPTYIVNLDYIEQLKCSKKWEIVIQSDAIPVSGSKIDALKTYLNI